MDGLTLAPSTALAPSIFARMSALADPLRCRALLLLERGELTVSELCTVLQLPQSTVSRHLKTLADDGWVQVRPEGTSRLYTAAGLDAAAQALWALVRPEVSRGVAADQDRHRLDAVLATRRSKSQEFFAGAAGRWADMRRELFGSRFDLQTLLGLLDRELVVGDLGAGTGQMTEALAPHVAKVIAVDSSTEMLSAARERLASLENVEVRAGRLEALPLEDAALDAAILGLVLHHMPDPREVLIEAARVLRPGGRLLIVDMLSHDHEDYRQRMGHLWLGFDASQVRRWCEAAGLRDFLFHTLTPDAEAKGPTLFVASATNPRRRDPS
jgi:ArsR family transcriptional regulator